MADVEKPTTKLDATPQWAADLMVVVRRLEANDQIIISSVDNIRERVNAHDARFAEMDARAAKNSGGVRQLSQSDAGQDMQIASLSTKVDGVVAEVDGLKMSQQLQIDILTRIDAVIKNPLVKTMAAMLATALVTWLATHGIQVPR